GFGHRISRPCLPRRSGWCPGLRDGYFSVLKNPRQMPCFGAAAAAHHRPHIAPRRGAPPRPPARGAPPRGVALGGGGATGSGAAGGGGAELSVVVGGEGAVGTVSIIGVVLGDGLERDGRGGLHRWLSSLGPDRRGPRRRPGVGGAPASGSPCHVDDN